MLTIKEPIGLKSLRPMQTVSDSLYQKLNANYALMNASFSPKDLLFLLTAPPEVLEAGGDRTNITILSNAQNTQAVTLEVVNNVVNRILMADHSSFTYQDQVYITSVLQKLGITNPTEFMEQVHKLRTENRDIQKLLSLYQDNETLLRTLVAAQEPEKRKQERTQLEEGLPSSEARYFIHNEIYSRLQTSNIYEIVQEFQHNPNIASKTLHFSELYLAQQERVSRLLSLSQIKERTLGQVQTNLQHYVNRYEMGSPDAPLQTEQQVLTEGAAAALLNLVDHVMVSHAETLNKQEDIWLDIRNAVSQSAEDVIIRFEAYHSAPQSNFYQDQRAYETLSNLYQEEITAISQLSQLVQTGGQTVTLGDRISSTQMQNIQMTHYEGTEQIFGDTEVTEQGDSNQLFRSTEELTHLTQQILQMSERQAHIGPEAVEMQRMTQQKMRQELERQLIQAPQQKTEETVPREDTPLQLTQEELLQITQSFPVLEQTTEAPRKAAPPLQTPGQMPVPPVPLQHREAEGEDRTPSQVSQKEDNQLNPLLSQPSETSGEAAKRETAKQTMLHIADTNLTISQEAASEITKIVLHTIGQETQRRREQAEQIRLEQEKGRPSIRHPVEDTLREEETPLLADDKTRKQPLGQAEGDIGAKGSGKTPAEGIPPVSDTAVNEPIILTPEAVTRILRQTLYLTKDETGQIFPAQREGKKGRRRKKQELQHPVALEGRTDVTEAAQQGSTQQINLTKSELNVIAKEIIKAIGQRKQMTQTLQTDTITNRWKEAAASEAPQQITKISQPYLQRIEQINEIQNQVLLQQQMYSEMTEQHTVLEAQEQTFLLQQEIQQLTQQIEQMNLQQVQQEQLQETLVHQQTEEVTELSQTSQETVEQTVQEMELLRQQLDQINQRNVERYQQMQSNQHTTQVTNVTPDRQRIFQDAIRSMEQPEQVLKELLESPAPMEHPIVPPGMAPMLEQMDQVSRKVYETLLQYERDPQNALASGMVQKGSAAQLEAQIKAVEREQQELSLTHQVKTEQESQSLIKETTETVMEQWRERPARSHVPPASGPRPKVPIVHKRQENQISEELLERLERQKREETQKVVTEQVVTKENVVQKEVMQTNQEVLAKTTEDITEMINRTLARQIGTISDRVYSQLERRLQTERARRGRL